MAFSHKLKGERSRGLVVYSIKVFEWKICYSIFSINWPLIRGTNLTNYMVREIANK